MTIPILGRGPVAANTLPPQVRLNIAESIGQSLQETKQLGIQHGRLILVTPVDRTSIEFMAHLDALHEAGCALVSINEHPVQDGNGRPALQVHVLFRMPRELAQ